MKGVKGIHRWIMLVPALVWCGNTLVAQGDRFPIERISHLSYNATIQKWQAMLHSADSQVTAALFEGVPKNIFSISGNPVYGGNRLLVQGNGIWHFGGGRMFEFMEIIPYLDSPDGFTIDPKALDSISYADSIFQLSTINNSGHFALIANAGNTYLAAADSAGWRVQPIIIKEPHTPTWLEQLCWYLALASVAGIAWLLYSNWQINSKVKREIIGTDNPLRPKSEKPIGLADDDLLGFSALEDAVVSIIRNPQTELPITIVVSGDWGSGKSSMMNRIREKLVTGEAGKRRFMTTWFNAWHLQGESSLLNAFLLSLIRSYERTYSNLLSAFRIKLFVQRFARLSAIKQIGVGFALAVILPLVALVVLHLLPKSETVDYFKTPLSDYCEILKPIINGDLFKGDASTVTTISAIVFGIISLVFLNRQFMPAGLSVFMNLLPKTDLKLDAEKAETGSREKFRQQFWEIMAAGAEGKRHVVFIDDLDRVGGDKVLEMLEGINFISDVAARPEGTVPQPNTIFILGMYLQEVKRNLGSQLLEKRGIDISGLDPVAAEERCISEGNRYIEKMVQLIVPVPFKSDNANFNLMYGNKEATV